jgi:lipopolysaccharide transport protein LptA
VKGWASAAKVDGIVVGRTTRIGDQLSIDVRLRSGTTGALVKTLVQRITDPSSLDTGVDTLAENVLAAADGLTDPPGTPAKAGAAARTSPTGKRKSPFGFNGWDSDRPMSIESQSLDAVRDGGKRRMVFQGNVNVVQGNLSIKCDRLDAFYPAEANQPDRLTCTGNVRLKQGDQRARCNEAHYDRANNRLTCKGDAVLIDGDNELHGSYIDIDLTTETMHVKGGARVIIQSEELRRNPESAAEATP